MDVEGSRYSIELNSSEGTRVECYNDPEDAMRAVNRMRATRDAVFIIRNDAGAELNDRQLAMIVMARRLNKPNEPLDETDGLAGTS